MNEQGAEVVVSELVTWTENEVLQHALDYSNNYSQSYPWTWTRTQAAKILQNVYFTSDVQRDWASHKRVTFTAPRCETSFVFSKCSIKRIFFKREYPSLKLTQIIKENVKWQREE